jgi:capsular polysaccharide export protein
LPSDRPVAAWLSKCSAAEVKHLADVGVPIVEVEDGFLRSQGLGADCVPPLSITVDRLGAYFDPHQPSELEKLLQDGSFSEEVLERARQLRALIVEAGLGKYEQGAVAIKRPAGNRRHILVPGQVEDDRSVMTGGNGLSNLDLLKRVRGDAPDAYILYKPHPDVLAGHRKGAVDERTCLKFADEIVGGNSISSLIAMVDEVHVNTSLAGFEALMRNKAVTTWGVPFYAGWGLTSDKGVIPARRTARRSVDQLVAAALLLYPRYLDPESGLPCPAEIVVERLINSDTEIVGAVVRLRRLQGKLMRRFRGVSR